ncbi:jg18682 [Pararge aegeria aegeria]|uniref:Jg18682 protein n=2 Tax=Pararge aegeria TaxID=116150 RepID=A0A8S4SER9_9NEOP|nr:jg18682 [Pararge aegeria aegeria]
MFKLLLRLGLVLLVLNIFITSCEGFRNRGGYGSKYESRGYGEPLRQKSSLSGANALASSTPTRRGLGLSAWSIIAVIVSIILAIVGMYYFSICYPVLCKKTKKYDMMGLPPPV